MAKYTIHFHSALWKLTENNKFCVIDADSYIELVKNCMNLFPRLRSAAHKILRQNLEELWIVVDGKLLNEDKLFMPPSTIAKITLVPLISGSGRAGMIIAGVILIVAIVALTILTAGGALAGLGAAAGAAAGAGGGGGAGIGAALGAAAGSASLFSTSQLIGLGLGILTTLLRSVLAPKASRGTDAAARKDSDIFSSLQNTTSPNNPVPLNYGMIRVSGQFITGSIRTINHTKGETVKVSSYI